MEKRFIYVVEGTEFEDTEAFGEGWKKAKALATELHAPIYRTTIITEVREEVFMEAGLFVKADHADKKNIKVF